MRYDPRRIEPKWQKKWLREKIYEPNLKKAKRPFYNLMMFPYPSAEGLHVGNMYAFTGTDIYGRFKRMQGHDVFEPIGLDGFGIHSENFAIKIGKHPAEQAKISEKNFYRQLEVLGNSFAWRERLETYDPEYYKWTQWIFVQMFKKGLAYRKKASVNWCPSCKTVLADEQVVAGKCERCGTGAIKKELEQWFFKITDYAERLLENLEKIDWSERVKISQRNWIGKSEGAEIEFRIKESELRIKVFTTRPDTLFGATYVVLAPEHPLLGNEELGIRNYEEVKRYVKRAGTKSEQDRIAEGREKTGVELKEIRVINPATKEEIPIWVADYVLGHVGAGAIMAVPAHDDRDLQFALKFGLHVKPVIAQVKSTEETRIPGFAEAKLKSILESGFAHVGGGLLINSGKFNGMDSEKAKWEITKFVSGQKKIQYRLRDWLISRQRYWGPPIPMIYCDKCDWQPVPEKDLPVKLPFVKNFRPTGTDQSPLASVVSFYKVRCPKCKSWARRETDVSDTFLDSAWYYLRYPSTRSGNMAWDPVITKKWLPVHSYIGGAEHSVLHLLYSRFLAMAFHDAGLLFFEEPFTKFRAHGLLIKEGAKMSKSKGNVVNPDDYIRAYGADALRMYLMFLGSFEQGGDFRDTGIRGITRFLERAWKLIFNSKFLISKKFQNPKPQALERLVYKTIKKVTEDIEGLQYNTAISALMVLLNAFEENSSAVTREYISVFLRLLAPFAPHITEELWFGKTSIHISKWPDFDPKLIEEKTFELVIQINGKVRDRVSVPTGTDEAKVREIAKNREAVQKYLGGAEPKKIIYVPHRLINFVR